MKSTDLGIFLHRSVYSETSLITWFYTKENGLQKFLFRGGKKKAHSLFPMAMCELSYYGRTNADLLNLTTVESVYPFTFQFNPVSSTIAFFMVECIKKSVHLGDKDEELFHLLTSFSNRLESDDHQKLLPLKFLIEFSDLLGFKPQVDAKTVRYFNLDAGEFQLTTNTHERIFSSEATDLIASILLDENPTIETKHTREQALNILLDYFSIHVPAFKELESLDIVREILS